MCFGGIGQEHRAAAWRVVFQTVGLRRELHRREIDAKDRRYFELLAGADEETDERVGCIDIRSLPTIAESFLIKGREPWGVLSIHRFRHHLPRKTMHQIDIDIQRIDAGHKTWEGRDVSCIFYHVLSLVAYRRPSLGYVQGMADMLIPFVLVFCRESMETAESSAYFCYSRLLDETQHNIIDMQAAMVRDLDALVEMVDPDFHRHLREIGLEVHMFAFRWFSCLFIREFELPLVYKILDTVFASENIGEAVLCFGLALLMSFKPYLVQNDFASCILFLQSIAEKSWEDAEIELLLSSARFYRNTICEASLHVWP